jgi:DNA-binding transcriptional LysR family regulator
VSGEFTISSLRVFVAAANCLNFSRAAAELGMTQPHVSAQISRLEGRLGAELFDRSPARGVRLTPVGELLLRHADPVVRELDAAQQEIIAMRGKIEGRIRLAASTTPGGYVLPGVLAAFSRSHPDVRVSLTVGSALSTERAVLSGDADLGVLAGQVQSDRLQTSVVGSVDAALVVPAQHPWARRRTIRPAELAEATLLVREEGSSTRAQVERELRRVSVTPNATWELNDIDAIKHAVVAGLGVAVLTHPAVQWEVRAGLLATLRIESLDLAQDISALWLKSKRLSTAALAFLALLRAERAR